MLKEQIQKDIITALKGGNKLELSVLRFVMSEIKYAEIDKHPASPAGRKELTDEEVITVLQKEMKKRKEAIDMFRKNNREEVALVEEKQLIVIEKYLPQQMDQKEIEQIVDATIKVIGSNPQMGEVIGMVMAKLKGRADGKLIADLVRNKLAVLK